ncbi:MAG: hypothetical protein ACON35_07610 [Candidatus Marinamargulisbacteria bacterium]
MSMFIGPNPHHGISKQGTQGTTVEQQLNQLLDQGDITGGQLEKFDNQQLTPVQRDFIDSLKLAILPQQLYEFEPKEAEEISLAVNQALKPTPNYKLLDQQINRLNDQIIQSLDQPMEEGNNFDDSQSTKLNAQLNVATALHNIRQYRTYHCDPKQPPTYSELKQKRNDLWILQTAGCGHCLLRAASVEPLNGGPLTEDHHLKLRGDGYLDFLDEVRKEVEDTWEGHFDLLMPGCHLNDLIGNYFENKRYSGNPAGQFADICAIAAVRVNAKKSSGVPQFIIKDRGSRVDPNKRYLVQKFTYSNQNINEDTVGQLSSDDVQSLVNANPQSRCLLNSGIHWQPVVPSLSHARL